MASHRWRGRLLLDKHLVQLPEIAAIQAAAQHVRRNLACALRSKLVPGHEFKIAIGTSQRNLETSMEKAGGLDHDHAGNAAVRIADNAALRIAVGQPEEPHQVSLSLPGFERRLSPV
jgi:hypothetical protein